MELKEPKMKVGVKRGFKKTLLGVYPEDWNMLSLRDECQVITKGTTPTSIGRSFRQHGIRFIKAESLSDDGAVKPDMVAFIDEETHRFLFRSQLQADDVLFSIAGVLGRVGLVSANVLPANTNQALGIIRLAKNTRLDVGYLVRFLRSEALSTYIHGINVQAAQANLSLKDIGDFLIPTPPTLAEQHAIATALSDVDGLIASLEGLLAKKRALKQGAMQQLLIGQKRLPGFTGEWGVKTFGELFSFGGGYSASRAQLTHKGHSYLHYGDIHMASHTLMDVQAEYHRIPRLDVPLSDVSPVSLLNDGDVVFVDASEDDDGVSKHVVVSNPEGVPFISGLHTIVAKPRPGMLDKAYARYCFQTADMKRQFRFYAVGTKVSGISKANIPKLTVPVPSPKEQAAIGAILSDMDAELGALEAKLGKTRLLKQGMMQELLTGRKRLVAQG